MLSQVVFLVYLSIGVSVAHPSTERSVFDDFSSRDSYADDYQEIFPVPLLDYLSENSDQLTASSSPTNLHANLSANLTGQSNPSDKVNLHALPSIELSDHFPYQNSFMIVHSPSQNQYLNLARVNPGDQEKRFILSELKGPLTSKPSSSDERTSVTILHPSKRLSNINLSLSFSQPTSTVSTSTLLPNTTTGALNVTSLTSLSSVSGPSNGSSNDPAPNATNFSSFTLSTANSSASLTNRSSSLTIELVSTNIEKPKELAKSSVQENRATNQALPDEIDVNRTLLTSEELLDNNSTASYAALGDDALKLDVNDSTFNKINSTGLDLIYDALNDTITDDVSLNSTVRTG